MINLFARIASMNAQNSVEKTSLNCGRHRIFTAVQVDEAYVARPLSCCVILSTFIGLRNLTSTVKLTKVQRHLLCRKRKLKH